MQIWVDADACPGEIKGLLFRAVVRTQTKVTLGDLQQARPTIPNLRGFDYVFQQ